MHLSRDYVFTLHITLIFLLSFFFFNATATTEIYTLSLHDALPIWRHLRDRVDAVRGADPRRHSLARRHRRDGVASERMRSEEHTSELQSHSDLVCRLLLEKKKKKNRR